MPDSPPSSVDVVVVGSGPSGSVVTHTLAKHGLSVACLEQGDFVQSSDFPGNYPEWELLIQHRWAHDPNLRQVPADYPLNNELSDMSPVMYNGVGGTSLIFGGHWHRLLPSDFRFRTLHGEGEDWPISYEEMTPYHRMVDNIIAVSGLEGDPAYPPGLEYQQGPLPLGKAGLKAAEGMNHLGWHWWPGSQVIPTHRHDHMEGCVRYGLCEFGCPQGAKASADRAFLPFALEAGAKLITGARVRQVTTDSRGRATGVLWTDREGQDHELRANAVVLCANGVGTPRILLNSASPSHPNGLANSSGQVGRNLMLHPCATVTGYFDEDLESWKGPAGQLMYSMEFYESDPTRGFVGGAKWDLHPTPGPLSAIETHRQLPFDQLWGAGFHQVARTHRRGLMWCSITSDLPEATNRVTIDPELTDWAGIPAPKVEYRLSENSWRNLRFNLDRMRESLEAAGAAETYSVDVWIDQPGHLLGTARMGADARDSVVDSFGRAHDVPNLFVADGSLFVTSGGVNPTSTITALAMRVATSIVEHAANEATVV